MGTRKAAWLILLFLAGFSDPARTASGEDPYDRAVRRAIALLPRHAAPVLVVDANNQKPEVLEKLLRLDSFILEGRREIYLTMHTEVLKRALNGSELYEHMLATIIWHEMAHLDGADERGAERPSRICGRASCATACATR